MKGEKTFLKENIPAFSVQGRSDDNEKMSWYRKFNRGFNFYKENYIHDIPVF
jgi:hypothetical protein